MGLDEIVKLAEAHKWVVFAAVIISLFIRLCKADNKFPITIRHKRLYPWISLSLGLVAGVLAKKYANETTGAALVGGLIAGLLPVTGHQLVVESLRNGKEVPIWLRITAGPVSDTEVKKKVVEKA